MRNFTIYEDGGQYVELSAPLKIYYDITTDCNLNCTFCFKDKRNRVNTSLESAKKIIDQVADSQVMDIVFLGGEPLVCPFLFDAIEYAKYRGLNVGIITNGTLFTRENALKLKKVLNNSISISIHAHTNELHDEISGGEQVLDKIINGLKIVNEAGIIPELAFTPIKKNVNYLYETISNVLHQEIKISDVLVNRLIPSGNAISLWSQKEITLSDQRKLFEQMDHLSSEFPDLMITTGDAIPFCMVEEKYRKYIVRCDYAITLGWINENNLFGKCMCRGSKGFDSLDKNTIRELWKTSNTFLEHRCLRSVPDDCKKCEWIALCGGGCACSSYDKSLVQDAYYDKDMKYVMPKIDTNKVNYSNTLSYTENDIITTKQKFIFRKEKESTNDFDEKFLLVPLSSGAIIQDVIQPEDGFMLWVNTVEKQVCIYLQHSLKVNEIIKLISYEFSISVKNATELVFSTINELVNYNMVLKK